MRKDNADVGCRIDSLDAHIAPGMRDRIEGPIYANAHVSSLRSMQVTHDSISPHSSESERDGSGTGTQRVGRSPCRMDIISRQDFGMPSWADAGRVCDLLKRVAA